MVSVFCWDVQPGLRCFPRGFNLLFYVAAIVLTALLGWFMVSIAIRRPVKIAAGISPIEAVRFTGSQSGKAHTHKKNMRLNPLSMGIANFRRDRKNDHQHRGFPEPGRRDPFGNGIGSFGPFAGADRKTVFPGWGL